MNRLEHLMQVLGEECGELAVRASKINRFGLSDRLSGVSNQDRLIEEFNDLLAVAELLNAEFDLNLFRDYRMVDKKKAKVLKYMQYAKDQGTLNPFRVIDRDLPDEDYKSSLAIAEELMDQSRSADYYCNGAGDLEREGSETIEALVDDLIQRDRDDADRLASTEEALTEEENKLPARIKLGRKLREGQNFEPHAQENLQNIPRDSELGRKMTSTTQTGSYDIWCEGFIATGQEGPAMLMAKNVEASSFEEACNKFFLLNDTLYLAEKLTHWGRKLFDNEADARKRFG